MESIRIYLDWLSGKITLYKTVWKELLFVCPEIKLLEKRISGWML
jgi:hypothetical protein